MNNDTDRLSDNLSATHRWRATSPMWSPTPNPMSRPEGRKIKSDNECLLSNINSHCDPASRVTTLALLVGSRNTTGPLPLEASLAYGEAETAIGKGCKMIPCLSNSISEFRLAVTMPKLNFELRRNRNQAETKMRVTAVTETRPKPRNLAVSAPKP